MGKCLSINCKNVLPTFVCTFLEDHGFNQVMLPGLFHFGWFLFTVYSSYSLNPLHFSASLYVGVFLLNSSMLHERLETLLLMDLDVSLLMDCG